MVLYQALLCLALCLSTGVPLQAQTNAGSQQQADDVVRVNTELVQTDVMVFDRRGRFVDGLKPEQFVLTLNGEAKPISLFDRVGSASGRQTFRPAASKPGPVSEEMGKTTPGRVIFFFIDDSTMTAGHVHVIVGAVAAQRVRFSVE